MHCRRLDFRMNRQAETETLAPAVIAKSAARAFSLIYQEQSGSTSRFLPTVRLPVNYWGGSEELLAILRIQTRPWTSFHWRAGACPSDQP